MPVNEKTGKADRSKVREEDILQYRIDQVKKRAGKQPVRRRRQVTEVGSGASPSTMLMTLDLETPSSHSPVTPSGSPPRTSGSPAAAGATEPRPVDFYIQVPELPKSFLASRADPKAAVSSGSKISLGSSTHPAPVTTPATTSATPTAPLSTAVPAADADISPETAVSSAAGTSPAVPAPPAAATPPASADSPSPACPRSPAVAPALRRLMAPESLRASAFAAPSPPTSAASPLRQHDHDNNITGPRPESDLSARIRALEMRMNDFEEWRRRDEEWKRQLDERLSAAGL